MACSQYTGYQITTCINTSVNPFTLRLTPPSPSGLAEVIIPGMASRQHIFNTDANPHKQNGGGEKVSCTPHTGNFQEVSFM